MERSPDVPALGQAHFYASRVHSVRLVLSAGRVQADGSHRNADTAFHRPAAEVIEGPSTRYSARTFVVWAIKARRLPPVTFPRRKGGDSPILTQDERLALLRRFLHEPGPTTTRIAAVLLLFYAQPLTRIARLRLQDITTADDITTLHLGGDAVPGPVLPLLTQHLDGRRNTNTAANVDSPWLFPGYRPGQPLDRSRLMNLVRDSGVHLLGGRNSALRQLVLDMPPAIAAQALGYSPQIAEAHARNAGTTWVTYASYRSGSTRT